MDFYAQIAQKSRYFPSTGLNEDKTRLHVFLNIPLAFNV